jgi:hypothetical protein
MYYNQYNPSLPVTLSTSDFLMIFLWYNGDSFHLKTYSYTRIPHMKKLILLSLIASTAIFADMMTDMASKAATDYAKKEATHAVSKEVAKATDTDKTEAAEKTTQKATETKEATPSMKDQAIDMAAGKVKEKTGVEKEVTKSVIKSVI